jgi:hypothetical protein
MSTSHDSLLTSGLTFAFQQSVHIRELYIEVYTLTVHCNVPYQARS